MTNAEKNQAMAKATIAIMQSEGFTPSAAATVGLAIFAIVGTENRVTEFEEFVVNSKNNLEKLLRAYHNNEDPTK